MTLTIDGIQGLAMAVAVVFAGRLLYDVARLALIAVAVKARKAVKNADVRPVGVRLAEYRNRKVEP